jgi:hypothetical protein
MSRSRSSAVAWGVEISPPVDCPPTSLACRHAPWPRHRSPPPAVGATAALESARLLVTAHGICGQYPAGRAHRAGRGREHVRCSRPGCLGPRAPLSHPTPAVFAAKHCERNFADMSYPVISYSSMAYAEPIVGETSLTTSLLVKPGMHQGRGHVHAPARSWDYPFTAVCCWVMGRALGRSLRSALADGRPMIAKHSAVCLQACKPESAS